VSVLVPFATSWHPLAVAWGVVSFYLLVAVEVTSLLRSRIPKSWWRKTHYASFGLFLTSTAHGVTAGTDTGGVMLRIFVLMVGSLFVGLTAARLVEAAFPPQRPTPRRLPVRDAAGRTG
jgi:hypothetical protein